MVSFAESPNSFHMTPETDPLKAFAWAKRNRLRLLSAPEKPLFIPDMAPGFFDESGAWYQDQIKKGRSMTPASLGIRQGHIENYIIPLFGNYDIRELTGADIDRAILDAERFTLAYFVNTFPKGMLMTILECESSMLSANDSRTDPGNALLFVHPRRLSMACSRLCTW